MGNTPSQKWWRANLKEQIGRRDAAGTTIITTI